MQFIRKCSVLIFFIGGIFLMPSTYAADIYKYVDQYGKVTLTDTPINNKYVRLVKTWKGWVPQEKSTRYEDLEKNRKKYSKTIDVVAKRYKLPRSLIHAIITAESAYDSNAVSRAGAVGLMQLMPSTAKRYGVKDRRNPYENISGGSRYIRDLLMLYNNNLQLVLAAYNAGEGTVKKYNYKIPPYKETQNYVKKVIAFYKKYQQSIG